MNKPQSLYIHIPFCEHICDYCDFPKLQYFRIFAQKYIDVLIEEIESLQIDSLKTIYIGGGTPTALEDDLFLKLLSYLDKYLKNVIEYTIEANPESLSINKLKMMKEHGVNRLSIGVESTNDKILKAINRHHTFFDVKNAVNNARKFGFDNINVDLIIGLPNVTKHLLNIDIENILSLDIDHVSCYSLSVHPHTVFYLKGIEENSSDKEREYYDLVHEKMQKSGFIHYEISNWAKKDKESEHNLTYWRNEHYYGVGLGASGYIDQLRYTNTKNINKYLNKDYKDYKEIVTLEDDRQYFIMLSLRTIEGLSLTKYQNKYHDDLLKRKNKEINQLINNKLLIYDDINQSLIPTYEGMMILDQIILQLI